MEVLRAVTRLAWPSAPAPQPRPFWVIPGDWGRPRGLVAATLEELLEQAGEALAVRSPLKLVLAEDGTPVPSEKAFAALAPHTSLMALGPGQSWEPPKSGPLVQTWERWENPRPRKHHPSDEVARVTVALAKGGPHDLVGQLRVSANVRGVSCDVGGVGPEWLLRELLRLLAAMTRALGRSLLGVSATLRRLLDGATSPGVTYEG